VVPHPSMIGPALRVIPATGGTLVRYFGRPARTVLQPGTGELLRQDVRPQTIRIGSMSRVVEVPCWYSDDDGDSHHRGTDLKATNGEFIALRDA